VQVKVAVPGAGSYALSNRGSFKWKIGGEGSENLIRKEPLLLT